MIYRIQRSELDIDEQLNRAIEAEDTGHSAYPGMSFEEGVKAGIEWVIGQTDEVPIPGEEDEGTDED